MKHRIAKGAGLLLLAGGLAVSCTDMESLDIKVTTPADRDPGQYAKYVDNLLGYKASDHKVTYAFFDNGIKAPFSQGQHITALPDSVDYVVMAEPQLADFELSDIASVHAKGTEVLFSVSYDDILAAYEDIVKEAEADSTMAAPEPFTDYLRRELDARISGTDGFDGLLFRFTGKDPVFLEDEELEEYSAAQAVLLDAVTAWRSQGGAREIVFMGLPQNLVDRTVLSDCRHIILDGAKASDEAQLELMVSKALVSGVPGDRFVIGVSTVSLSAADTDTGWWGSSRALDRVASWVTEEAADHLRAGIAVYEAQNDYYATSGSYTFLRRAIETMNPSPARQSASLK